MASVVLSAVGLGLGLANFILVYGRRRRSPGFAGSARIERADEWSECGPNMKGCRRP